MNSIKHKFLSTTSSFTGATRNVFWRGDASFIERKSQRMGMEMGTAAKRRSNWPTKGGKIPRSRVVPNAQPTLQFNRRGLKVIDISETIASIEADRKRGTK
jgi:hypothetical protein